MIEVAVVHSNNLALLWQLCRDKFQGNLEGGVYYWGMEQRECIGDLGFGACEDA